jgi:hypothetical protein
MLKAIIVVLSLIIVLLLALVFTIVIGALRKMWRGYRE